MAAAIPIIATFASGAAAGGTIAAGATAVGALATGSLAGFLTVAGGIAGSIGALTGKKSLQRIGGLMALGGGLVGLAQGAFGSAVDAATAGTAQEAANAAWSAGGAAEVAGGAGVGAELGSIGQQAAEAAGAAGDTGSLWSRAQPDALAQINTAESPAGSLGGAADPTGGAGGGGSSLYQKALQSSHGVQPAQAAAPMDPITAGADKLAQGASEMTSQELQAYLAAQKAKALSALKSAGGWIRDNKELVSMGGNALASMYGPAAEKLDWEQSIYNRRVGNLNTPIPLANGVR